MPRQAIGVPDENFDEDTARAETSFADSGLDFPLGSSWGYRKMDIFRKPVALQLIYRQEFQGRIHDEVLAKPKEEDFPKSDWTYSQEPSETTLGCGSIREDHQTARRRVADMLKLR